MASKTRVLRICVTACEETCSTPAEAENPGGCSFCMAIGPAAYWCTLFLKELPATDVEHVYKRCDECLESEEEEGFDASKNAGE